MRTDDSPEVRALVAALRALCGKLPDSEEYVMVHHPAFRVGKKPFVIAGMQHEGSSATVSINLGRDMQHQLLDDQRFQKTPYIGQHGWVTVAYDDLKKGELDVLVRESFRRVANKKQLAQLDEVATRPPKQTKPKKRVGSAAAARRA